MPILEIGSEHVTHVCAACGNTRDVQLEGLTLGVETEDKRLFPNVLLLPQCECGAYEQIVRVMDQAEESVRKSAFGQRRALTNALCQRLIEIGNGHSKCQDHHRKVPPDLADLSKPDERRALIPEDVWQKKKTRDAARKG